MLHCSGMFHKVASIVTLHPIIHSAWQMQDAGFNRVVFITDLVWQGLVGEHVLHKNINKIMETIVLRFPYFIFPLKKKVGGYKP